MKLFLRSIRGARSSFCPSWAKTLRRGLIFFVLFLVVSPVYAGQLIFPFGDVFGPNEAVEVYGSVGYITDCTCCPGGIPDGWPYSIYPVADIYVLRDGTISGNSRARLTDISGVPNTVVGTPSIIAQIVAYTAPGGNLGRGEYDLVLDECQDGYYDPGRDFMLGTGNGVAFRVLIPTDISDLDTTAIRDAKRSAERQKVEWDRGVRWIKISITVHQYYNKIVTLIASPGMFLVMELVPNPYEEYLGMGIQLLDNLQKTLSQQWGGIAADPPDTNFAEFVELGQISLLHPVFQSGLEPPLVSLTNDAAEQAAILVALLSALEKFHGAREADNADFALLQAGQVKKFSDLLAANLGEVYSSLGDLAQELENAGIDYSAYATELVDMQNRLGSQGLTEQELARLQSVGLTVGQITQAVEDFLAEDFVPLQSEDVLAVLQEFRDSTLEAISSYEELSLAATDVIDSLTQLVDLWAPVADPAGPYFGDEGTPILFNGSGSYDPNLDPITYTWELNGDGLFDDAFIVAPQYTYYTELSRLVGLMVTDTTGLFNVGYAELTIAGVNGPPVIDSMQPGELAQVMYADETLEFYVEASDPDGDQLEHTWTLNDSVVGTGDRYTFSPGPSEIGVYLVVVTVSDGNQFSQDIINGWNALVRIPNRPPMINSVPDTTAVTGVSYTYEIQATDPDGDYLTYSLDVSPVGMIIVDSTGAISWTPTADQTGLNDVTVRVEDGQGGVVTQAFTINVRGVNHPPEINSLPDTTADMGIEYSYDVDATDPDGDPLTYFLDTFPAGMTIDENAGLVSWIPTVDQLGPNPVILRVEDGRGGTATQSFTINVLIVNHPPVITSVPDTTAIAGEQYEYDVEATDPDGDTVTYSLMTSPVGMTIDGATGLISWIPAEGQVGANPVTVNVADDEGETDTQTFTISVTPPSGLRVNVMPDGIYNPPVENTAYAWPGLDLSIWGNVHGGTPPYTYTWDFGDGTPLVSSAVTDPRYIAEVHAYASMGPKFATLTVTDADGISDSDQVRIDVVAQSMDAKVNLAIEKGLRWLYLHNYSHIYWQGWRAEGQYRVGAFGMEILAFENRGHRPTNDIDDDIYAEYVQQGLDILFSLARTQSIGPQPHGNPDTDGDNVGVYLTDGTRPAYETGIAIMAIVGSGAPDRIATSGPVGVNGLTYAEIVQDAVDYCAWGQNESGGGRGGWRYYPNYGSSDNSVSQWPAIGLEAAETNWGIATPDFVKTELLLWLAYSQNPNGGFGYTSNYGGRVNVGLTGAGICELSYSDIPHSDSRIQRTLDYISNNWYQGNSYTHGNMGNYYAMYAVAKGCRIAVDESNLPHEIEMIGSHDWQDEYNGYLVTHQYDDGHWDGSNYGSRVLDTGFGVLILTPAIAELRPVAIIDAPESVPPNTPFNMDGGGSYHMDPNKMIVEWLWDFDKSDGVDWDDPDAAGSQVVNPGYSLPVGVLADTFVITLRVADNGHSIMTDIAEHIVIVNFENHPPIAEPGGPYAAMVGEIISFDGTGSYDPDSGDYVVSYSWDINGDGVLGDCMDSICQNSWNYVYSGYVGLVVTDAYGVSSDTSAAYVSVWTSEVDVGIDSSDIFFSCWYPMPGDTVTVFAAVHCDTASDPVSNVRVRFYHGDPDIMIDQIGVDQIISNLTPGATDTVQVDWCAPDTFVHNIYVRVDPDGEIEEYNESNNEASRAIKPVIARCEVFIAPEMVIVGPGEVADYAVSVWNEGGNVDDYLLSLSGLPSDFERTLLDTIQGVGANDTTQVPLVITTPHDLSMWYDTPYPFTVACTSLTYPEVSNDTSQAAVIIAQPTPKTRVRFTNELLDALIAQVENADIEDTVKLSLLDKLLAAEHKKEQGLEWLEAGNTNLATNMFTAAANILRAFINHVEAQRDKAIDRRDANHFIARADDIIWRLEGGIWDGVLPKIATEEEGKPVHGFELFHNYPNPFNPRTEIKYALPNDCHVKLTIYNILGQRVRVLVDEYQSAGHKSVKWDGKDEQGREVSSGVYFYRIQAGDFVQSKKMVLMK